MLSFSEAHFISMRKIFSIADNVSRKLLSFKLEIEGIWLSHSPSAKRCFRIWPADDKSFFKLFSSLLRSVSTNSSCFFNSSSAFKKFSFRRLIFFLHCVQAFSAFSEALMARPHSKSLRLVSRQANFMFSDAL